MRGSYRGHEIISMPPPSSGGAVLIQMLNILEGFDLQKLEANSSDRYHLMAESMRRAFADRAEYMGDRNFSNSRAKPRSRNNRLAPKKTRKRAGDNHTYRNTSLRVLLIKSDFGCACSSTSRLASSSWPYSTPAGQTCSQARQPKHRSMWV